MQALKSNSSPCKNFKCSYSLTACVVEEKKENKVSPADIILPVKSALLLN
jgi:hypothetical protein